MNGILEPPVPDGHGVANYGTRFRAKVSLALCLTQRRDATPRVVAPVILSP